MNNQKVKFQSIFEGGEGEKGAKQRLTFLKRNIWKENKYHKQKAEENRQHHI